jgi:phospholipid/cholesterol/gamma-HCH transport system substrate-binding protein
METTRAMEVKVGALVLASAALFAGFVFLVGNPALGPGITLQVSYAFTGPIKQGATVRISGVTVGQVREVDFLGERPGDAAPDHPVVRLKLFVQERARGLLTRGTRFYVTTLGMLGEHYVEVVPGPASAPPLRDGEEIRGVDLPRTDLMMARASALVEQMAGLIEDNEVRLLDLVTAASGMMKRVDAVLGQTDVAQFLGETRATLGEARAVLLATRRVVQDPEALAAMVREGPLVMEEARALMASLGATGPETLARTNDTLASVQGIVPRLESLLRSLEKAGYSDEKRLAGILSQTETVMARVEGLSTRADTLLQQMERGEGSAGKLIRDDDVYNDLKSLLRDLRENPWRLMVPGERKSR